MISGRKKSVTVRQAAEVLDSLARKLPDGVLEKYVENCSPAEARSLLKQAADILVPKKTGKQSPPSQASLWTAEDKSWQGKLAGQALLLFTDGASRGNPGEAGAGIAIYDEQGNELAGTGQYLGKCTNNEAEYRALLFGLSVCLRFGRGRLKLHLDSELIVRQIRGEYKVKHPNLQPLFQETMQRLTGFASFSITHVRREKNRRADELANQAIDNK